MCINVFGQFPVLLGTNTIQTISANSHILSIALCSPNACEKGEECNLMAFFSSSDGNRACEKRGTHWMWKWLQRSFLRTQNTSDHTKILIIIFRNLCEVKRKKKQQHNRLCTHKHRQFNWFFVRYFFSCCGRTNVVRHYSSTYDIE